MSLCYLQCLTILVFNINDVQSPITFLNQNEVKSDTDKYKRHQPHFCAVLNIKLQKVVHMNYCWMPMMSYLADLFGVDKLKRLIVSIKELLFVICLIVIQGFFTPVLASAFEHLLQSAIEKSVLKFENKNIPGFKLCFPTKAECTKRWCSMN